MEDNTINEKDFDLTEQFTRIQWLLHRYNLHNRLAYGPMGDPHRGQGRILKLLKLQPEISQKDLSYLLDMRPQSLGEILVKLERNGYITITPSESDKRVMIIKLTEEGEKLSNEKPDMDTPFNCLTEEEQNIFSEFLTRIAESLEKQLGREKFEQGFDFKNGFGPIDPRFMRNRDIENLRRHGHCHPKE